MGMKDLLLALAVGEVSNLKSQITDVEKYVGAFAVGVPVPAPSGSTDLFTSSDVSVGDTIYYSITTGTGTPSGYNAYIELQNSGGSRLAIYGKTSISTTATDYTGTFKIPANFSKAVLKGTCVGAYMRYVSMEGSITAINSEVSEINGILQRLTEPNLFNKATVTDNYRLDPAGQTVQATGSYLSDYISVVGGYKYYKNSPTQDSYHRVAYYTKAQTAIADSVSSDNVTTAPSNAAYARICGLAGEKDTAVFCLSSAIDNVARTDIKAANKAAGVVAANVAVPAPSGTTDLFSLSDVSIGDTVSFSISIGSGVAYNYNAYIELQNASGDRISIYGKTLGAQTATKYTGSFAIPLGFHKAVLKGTCAGAFLEYVRIEPAEVQNISTASTFSFVGTAKTIFENDDDSAIAGVDGGLLNTVSVIKVSDSMYYMYYEAFGTSGGDDSTMNICFAYSEDGETFIKGFPSGVEAPISGTNKIFATGTAHGQCVVKVPDNDFPFRLIATTFGEADYVPAIWKSADGVNFTKIREITTGGNDSPVSCIVRGNTLKIFVRTYISSVRTIGVIYTDLDGNRYNSQFGNLINSGNPNAVYYQASASALDEHREIMLPTIYNPTDYTETVGCLILDGGKCTPQTIDTSTVITSEVKSIYFASGIVDIGLKTYAFYETRNADHQSFVLGTTKSAIKRIEVKTSP